MIITESALTWPLLPSAVPDVTPAPGPTDWANAQAAALNWLWSQSGRRYGTRVATYRPQGLFLNRGGYFTAIPYLQSIYGPLWGDSWDCGDIGARTAIELPGPAVSVTSVTLTDGAGVTTVLAAGLYRLDGDYLVRTDGNYWPTTQDLRATAGTANTWTIVYVRGVPAPVDGQIALALLAKEWLKGLVGASDCKLPLNATSSSRAGTTVALDLTKAYRTSGIAMVDRFVTNANPDGLRHEPSVWSPDLARNGSPYAGSRSGYVTP